ncbi:MAG: hypothetical protein BRC36_03140 [Cyanobacteria bacterium QH_2_48_84]|nr:MAG: hypothetical protein BRC36_03140 [Cyanobacteria bacterium QH_2_48_84]
MQLEDYFDFLPPDDIRIKGTRSGIETVLYDFIHRDRTPEEITQTYPSLTREQVYATILYYLDNKKAVSKYVAEWLEWHHQQLKAQQLTPSPSALRLRKLRTQKEAEKRAHDSQISAG